MFHVKHSYRFSPDYLSETWLLLAFASGPGRAPRRAGRDRPAGPVDPIDRGPRRPIRGARIPAPGPRSSGQSGPILGPIWRKSQKKIGKTGRKPPIRDFLLKIRSRLDFWQFLAKTTKKGKKIGSLVELVGTGRGEGRRTGRESRSRSAISTCSAPTSEDRGPGSARC